MNTTIYYSPAAISGTTSPLRRANTITPAERIRRERNRRRMSILPVFHKVTRDSMDKIWPILEKEPGRTTDFSYGGMLMWVDYFNYEYAIIEDTLFIRGVVESDRNTPAFSLPVGKLPMADSLAILQRYCDANGETLELSAVPEYALPELTRLGATKIESLDDWGDYLYDAETLATIKGKKMSKKRNHVNQFLTQNPEWSLIDLTPENAHEAMEFMDIYDLEGDDNESARSERELTRHMISEIAQGNRYMRGALLYAGGKVCAFTIADVKGDTLFIHIEKATREVAGSYEMINKSFAEKMITENPSIKYINREDCAGDEGLRKAKESYHPLEVLKKFNVLF